MITKTAFSCKIDRQGDNVTGAKPSFTNHNVGSERPKRRAIFKMKISSNLSKWSVIIDYVTAIIKALLKLYTVNKTIGKSRIYCWGEVKEHSFIPNEEGLCLYGLL